MDKLESLSHTDTWMASIWAQLVVLCGGSTLCGDFEHKPSTGQPPKVPICQNGPVVGLHKHALVALFFLGTSRTFSLSPLPACLPRNLSDSLP
jgi:hypothetical protein